MSAIERLAAALFATFGWHSRYNPQRPQPIDPRGPWQTYDDLPQGILSGDADNEEWAMATGRFLAADLGLATDLEFGEAWRECEAAVPEGWHFGSLSYSEILNTWRAFVVQPGSVEICDMGAQHRHGLETLGADGPTAAAALRMLDARLREMKIKGLVRQINARLEELASERGPLS